jgi:hypothetical protein
MAPPQPPSRRPAARIGTRTSLESIPAFTPASSASIVTHGCISQPGLNQTTPQAGPHLFDGAGHIFSMYLEMAVEEDKKMTEAWKADADGILIFVSISLLCHSLTELMAHRLVYSLRLSPHRFRCLSRTFGQIRRTPPRSTLQTSIRFLLIRTDPTFPSLLPLHCSLHPYTLSGSTHFGV